MSENAIKFNEPYITGKELEYINDVFERRHFHGNGFYTKKCQNVIQSKISSKQILLTDSCTSALEMAALLIKDWDSEQEVIMPSYTFTSTAAAFVRSGFKVIFVEVDPLTMMVDYEDARSKINKKTAAVVIVHYGGFGAKANLFRKLCDENSIYLIEDSAQAFGCIEGDKHLGTIGDFGCFSFHETKNLHAGLSGALSINNSNFIDRAVHVWERGTNRQQVLKGIKDKYSWVEVGGSFYPTELQAAFLLAQLESFEDNILKRKEIFYGYFDTFETNRARNFYYPKMTVGFTSNFHAFWVMFATSEECNHIRTKLLEKGIYAYIGYVPLHSSKVGYGMGYKENDLPITQKYSNQILRLPFHNLLQPEEPKMIANSIFSLLSDFRS